MLYKKDFQKIAEIIDCHANKAYGFIVTKPFIEHLADYLVTTNPGFDREKFLAACGVEGNKLYAEGDKMSENLLTTGQIAEQLQEPFSRVLYIISKYRLKPDKRMGIFRLFGEEKVKAIKQGLYDIQIRG